MRPKQFIFVVGAAVVIVVFELLLLLLLFSFVSCGWLDVSSRILSSLGHTCKWGIHMNAGSNMPDIILGLIIIDFH